MSSETRLAKSRERKSDTASKASKESVCVLQDADGLQEAMKEASKGGKKKILGLYTPDGTKIDTNVKVETHLQKDREDAKTGMRIPDLKKKKKGLSEDAKKANLNEVAQAYNKGRQFKQKEATKARRNEDAIDDEDAEKYAKSILGKTDMREQQGFEKLFNFFDVDKDRTWGSIEFAQRMTDIGFPTGVEDAANLLYFAGVRDVDRITYNDFLAMMPKLQAFRRLIEKDAMKTFSRYDDGSGFISVKDLKEVIHRLSGPEPLDKSYVDAICKKADREKTGRIPFDFVIRAMFGSPPLVPYQRDPSTIRSPLQQLLASFGRCCAAKPKRGPIDEEMGL